MDRSSVLLTAPQAVFFWQEYSAKNIAPLSRAFSAVALGVLPLARRLAAPLFLLAQLSAAIFLVLFFYFCYSTLAIENTLLPFCDPR